MPGLSSNGQSSDHRVTTLSRIKTSCRGDAYATYITLTRSVPFVNLRRCAYRAAPLVSGRTAPRCRRCIRLRTSRPAPALQTELQRMPSALSSQDNRWLGRPLSEGADSGLGRT